MIAYVDTSVILRMLVVDPHPLAEWKRIRGAYASRVLVVELGRVIDRLRLTGVIDDEAVALLHEQSRKVLRSMDLVGLDDAVLEAAARPMPTILGTLDALHLATALEIRRELAPDLVFATHDAQLARAARASGLPVVG
jgi:predicted nucleic acid-binding protein